MSRAFIGLGSNVDRKANLAKALLLLRKGYGMLTVSTVYESEPVVGFDGDNFYNLVVGLETDASPHELSERLHEIEFEQGRRDEGRRFAPRTLDLDLLLYDDLVLRDGDVDLPRRDVTDYAFVLLPLAEIAGDERHPETGQRYRDLWDQFDARNEIRLWPVEEPIEPR